VIIAVGILRTRENRRTDSLKTQFALFTITVGSTVATPYRAANATTTFVISRARTAKVGTALAILTTLGLTAFTLLVYAVSVRTLTAAAAVMVVIGAVAVLTALTDGR